MDNPENKKAVITGAGGLLGRHMANQLDSSGWKVIALSHPDLDVTDEESIKRIIGAINPDIVINCAATTDVDRCECEHEWAFAINENGPRFLSRISRDCGASIVHVSTDYVFDGEKDGFYTQDDKPNPLSVYAESKMAGEMAVFEESKDSFVIRTSWIYGPGGRNFGSCVINLAKTGAKIKGVTDQISIPTYAPDLAARIEEIINIGTYGLYHITSAGPTNWYDFARAILDFAGFENVEIQPVTRADLRQLARRPRNTPLLCNLSGRLGLYPLRHWNETLSDFISAIRG